MREINGYEKLKKDIEKLKIRQNALEKFTADSIDDRIKGASITDGGFNLKIKGDLYTFDKGPTILPAGSDGKVLCVDPAEICGLRWVDPGEAVGEGAWIDMVLQNGWVIFTAGWESPAYRMLNKSTVEFRGIIKSGTTTSDTVIANFPVGFRPIERVIFDTISNDAQARVDVKPDGDLITRLGVSSSWVIVKGIFSIT